MVGTIRIALRHREIILTSSGECGLGGPRRVGSAVAFSISVSLKELSSFINATNSFLVLYPGWNCSLRSRKN